MTKMKEKQTQKAEAQDIKRCYKWQRFTATIESIENGYIIDYYDQLAETHRIYYKTIKDIISWFDEHLEKMFQKDTQ